MSEEMNGHVHIPFDDGELEGELVVPADAIGIVVFAHGSGSSRHSPRNKFVASQLNSAGIGTLLFDLLTEEEDQVYETRFNIALLTKRLEQAYGWLKGLSDAEQLGVGFFGASTGAAAALMAAADIGPEIRAVVSRGGRPDLAEPKLGEVKSPTLLIVGGDDEPVIGMNESAFAQLDCEKKLEIVPGATHLFEEPGALEDVAGLAAAWFKSHLSS
jgi:dienelactone hydrolase